MGQADYYAEGDWNASCYECGFKFKASALQRHWQGYWVCKGCWEPRQPQDFARNVPDIQTPPWIQPLSTSFAYFCSPTDNSAVAGSGTTGCAQCGFVSPALILPLT